MYYIHLMDDRGFQLKSDLSRFSCQIVNFNLDVKNFIK